MHVFVSLTGRVIFDLL